MLVRQLFNKGFAALKDNKRENNYLQTVLEKQQKISRFWKQTQKKYHDRIRKMKVQAAWEQLQKINGLKKDES